MRLSVFWLCVSLAVFCLLVVTVRFFVGSADDGNGSTRLTLTARNVSADSTLSPGVIVVHTPDLSFNYTGTTLSEHPFFNELKQLFETANPTPLKERLGGTEGVHATLTTHAPLPPNTEQTHPLGIFSREDTSNLTVSFLSMVMNSNDGYVFVTADFGTVFDSSGNVYDRSWYTENFDAGTEENNPLNTGFLGGQIDLTRGEENTNNGIETDETVHKHPDLKGPPIAKIHFSQ